MPFSVVDDDAQGDELDVVWEEPSWISYGLISEGW
jgi:hypothetical protein